MKGLGTFLTVIGSLMSIAGFIWGRAGFYLSQAGALAALVIGGLVLIGIGSLLIRAGGRAEAQAPTWTPTLSTALSSPLPTLPTAAGTHPDAELAADPATSPAVPAELAEREPTLRAAIAGNPAAYPALLEWLASLRDSAVDAALAARGKSDSESSALTARATDPSTPPADLAELAHHYPELRTAIAENPAAYAELRDWIAAVGPMARAD